MFANSFELTTADQARENTQQQEPKSIMGTETDGLAAAGVGGPARYRRRGRPFSRAAVPSLLPQSSSSVLLAALLLQSLPVPSVNVGAIIGVGVVSAEEFNFEVGQRVRERLEDYMGDPASIAKLIAEYRANSAFRHDMGAADRNEFLKLNDALAELFPHFESVYYGLEDGVFVGTGFASRIANYREPGESGYLLDFPGPMEKHVFTCNDESGAKVPCAMNPGNPYVECVGGCSLERCADEDSQKDCGDPNVFSNDEERARCEGKVKWCKNYVRKSAPGGEEGGGGPPSALLGFVPRMTHCIDPTGVVSQTPGAIQKKETDVLGNCFYRDGKTMVRRSETGPFAFCGGEMDDGTMAVCNDTFVGAYLHRDYDPRWRGWYEATRAMQRNNWSPPYPFFTDLEMGITYSEPIYSLIGGRNVFMGVVAIDYTFENITEFLIENYMHSSTAVAVFEDAEPNYMIGSSTGSKAARKVLRADHSQLCVDVNRDDCTADRISILDLADVSDVSVDAILSRAFERQRDAGFPTAKLVTVKAEVEGSSLGAAYVSQTQIFDLPHAGLTWRIMILSPTEMSSDDSILISDPLFGFIVTIGAVGLVVCLALLYLFLKRRHMRAVIVSDWRFTSAFLLGCALLNAATLTLIGPNTDGMCLTRMWLFHSIFALAFSPLLVKTYRMMKLVGGKSFVRVQISHKRAALYCVPIVLTQVIILTVFTFVDPSRQFEIIESSGPDVTHRIICAHDTKAFFVVQMVFEGGLIMLGCVLAFKTRHLRGDFGESKQLIFTMYDIAVVGSVVVIVTNVMDGGQAGKRLLYAVGIFWGTAFSCCSFVVPRLIQARDDASQARAANARRIVEDPHVSQTSNLPSSLQRPSGLSAISETGNDDEDDDGDGDYDNCDESKFDVVAISGSQAGSPESAPRSTVTIQAI